MDLKDFIKDKLALNIEDVNSYDVAGEEYQRFNVTIKLGDEILKLKGVKADPRFKQSIFSEWNAETQLTTNVYEFITNLRNHLYTAQTFGLKIEGTISQDEVKKDEK